MRRGLSWPWETLPPLRWPPSHTTVSGGVLQHVEDMLEKGVVEKAFGKVFLSRLFTVPKKSSDKTRLVMDLSSLNKFLKPQHFKMVTVAQVRATLSKGDWLASLDLQDAYWHVPIHARYRRFLAFQVGSETFQFTRLPFGLSLAPRVFTKLSKVVSTVLAKMGVTTLMYLDDWLVYSPSKEKTLTNVRVAMKVLGEMGFVINVPKSSLVPSQQLDWLGIRWDTVSATLSLSPDNRLRSLSHLRRALFSRTLSRRQWESLLGVLNFAAPTFPLGRLMHRRLSLEVNTAVPARLRDLQRPVPRPLHRLLGLWLQRAPWKTPVPWLPPTPSLTVMSDASDIGWGYPSEQGHQRYGSWLPGLREAHINIRELWVTKRFLLDQPHLNHASVRFLMDNTAAVQAVNRQGSARSRRMLDLVEEIFEVTTDMGIHISAAHVRGVDNGWADALSRFKGTSAE